MSNYKYTPELEARMLEVVGSQVTEDNIAALMQETGYPRRSITAKLRSLGRGDVPTLTEAPVFTADETNALSEFLTSNSGAFTAAEISEKFMSGKFTDRQVRGKALALELTAHIKKVEAKVKPKTYTDAEEATIAKMVEAGKFLEEIAEAVGKPVNSVRGKLLSMELKAPQRDKKAPVAGGSYPDLATVAPTMTVEELVAHYQKTKEGTTARGIKTALSRRGINAKNYEAKKAA